MSDELQRGLEGVLVAESELSVIDGEAGELSYRGYPIRELAAETTFEEVVYLLWHGSLPTRPELESFSRELCEHRGISEAVVRTLEELAQHDEEPMAALRTGVSMLSAADPERGLVPTDSETIRRTGRRLTAKIPTVVAAYDRLRQGERPVEPDDNLGHAANFLYMLTGSEPDETAAETFDTALTLHADHGLNASTFTAMFDQEFSYSAGHVAAILNTCLFAPSLLTFWFVNGVLDFSTAVAIGAVASPAGLQVRVLAYLFVVPTFLLARVAVHLLHPTHRAQVLSGSYPTTQLLSLDWFSMGILATGLPLALQNFGPWFGMNAFFAVGLFVVPRFLAPERAGPVKLIAIVAGSVLFLYANYRGMFPVVPDPASVLGPVATFTLDPGTTEWLFRAVNSVFVGPFVVGGLGLFMNRLLTRPELTDITLVHYALPRRDPDAVVLTSAAFGTAFYLGVVFALTGQLVVVP